MAINIDSVKKYLRSQLKLAGMEDAQIDTYISSVIPMGGALFWRNNWQFAEKEGTFDTVADTVSYSLDDNLEVGVEGIMGIRRETSDDYGFDLRHEPPWVFDRMYPYPGSESTDEPVVYTIRNKNKTKYIELFPEPDAAYTLKVTYRLGWSDDMLAFIPDGFSDLFTAACMVYAAPPQSRVAQMQLYDMMLNRALTENKISRKRMSRIRIPGVTAGTSERDRALDRGLGYADDLVD